MHSALDFRRISWIAVANITCQRVACIASARRQKRPKGISAMATKHRSPENVDRGPTQYSWPIRSVVPLLAPVYFCFCWLCFFLLLAIKCVCVCANARACALSARARPGKQRSLTTYLDGLLAYKRADGRSLLVAGQKRARSVACECATIYLLAYTIDTGLFISMRVRMHFEQVWTRRARRSSPGRQEQIKGADSVCTRSAWTSSSCLWRVDRATWLRTSSVRPTTELDRASSR